MGAPTMQNLTTPSIPHDPTAQHNSLAENLRDRGFPIAGLPEAPRDDPSDPDELQQGELPTGPTHVAARRTPDQLASARKFIAAAGRVKFNRGRATLKAVWMSVAYYASLGAGPERVCFAQVKTLADRSLVSERAVQRHLATLAWHGLIQTNHRVGGHAPTKWSIQKVSPSVLGCQNVTPGVPGCHPRGDNLAPEVSNRSSAPTERELQLASKQPDGACAPPSARKKSAQKTKTEQPTRTADPTQALAPAKTDPGGVGPGGATEKQIKKLKILADRTGSAYAEDLWRAADLTRLQAQFNAAMPYDNFKRGQHTHGVDVEVIFRVGIMNAIAWREGVQRCECGAVRSAMIFRDSKEDSLHPWALSGYLVDYLVECTDLCGPMTDQELAEADVNDDDLFEALDGRWAAPMTFSDVRALCETAHKMTKEEASRFSSTEGDCQVDVPADWNRL